MYLACRSALTLVLVAFVCPSAELSEVDAKQLVEQFVRESAKVGREHFFRVTRQEELEDTLFGAQVKIRGQIRRAAMFFTVTETGYEIVSPSEVVYHGRGADGEWRWQVAVILDSATTLGLSGPGMQGGIVSMLLHWLLA